MIAFLCYNLKEKSSRGEGIDRTMSRIPPLNIPLPNEEGLAFATMGTLFRTMAHRPEIMQQSVQLLETVMRGGTVEPRLKELLAVRVSQVNHCFY
jgi:alkylhydroperoxidase family enzyme